MSVGNVNNGTIKNIWNSDVPYNFKSDMALGVIHVKHPKKACTK